MKTSKSVSFWSYLNLLLLEILGCALCLIASLSIMRLDTFKTPEIGSRLFPWMLGMFILAWLVSSLLAFKQHRGGIGQELEDAVVAIMTVSSTSIFVAFLLYGAHPSVQGMTFWGLLIFFIFVCLVVASIVSKQLVEAFRDLGRSLRSFYVRLGFEPS